MAVINKYNYYNILWQFSGGGGEIPWFPPPPLNIFQYYQTKIPAPIKGMQSYNNLLWAVPINIISSILTNSTHLPHPPTDDDGSASFEEFTKYVALLSLMESHSESPDSDVSEDDPVLIAPTDSLTIPTLEMATVAS